MWFHWIIVRFTANALRRLTTQDGMSVGKGREGRQLEVGATWNSRSHQTINQRIDMQTNTHDQNQVNLSTTAGASQAINPPCERLLLGIDQHAGHLRMVRQLDGAGTQPPQRVYPGGDLERFVKKQRAQAKAVYAVYEAGARQLQQWGVTCYVIRPMKLDQLGKGVNTHKTDAAELVSQLDRYLAGNRKAFAVVRVPTPEEEQRRCVSRQREQLRRERQRLNAMGQSLMLCQGYHCTLRDWWHERSWATLVKQLPAWLCARLEFYRTVLATVQNNSTC